MSYRSTSSESSSKRRPRKDSLFFCPSSFSFLSGRRLSYDSLPLALQSISRSCRKRKFCFVILISPMPSAYWNTTAPTIYYRPSFTSSSPPQTSSLSLSSKSYVFCPDAPVASITKLVKLMHGLKPRSGYQKVVKDNEKYGRKTFRYIFSWVF